MEPRVPALAAPGFQCCSGQASGAWLQTDAFKYIQTCGAFPDSKHAVDMPLLTSIEHLTQDWAALVARHPSGQPLPQQDVLQLVVRHLGPPGSDLEPAQLNDTPAVHPPPPAATSNDAHPPPPAAAASSNGKSDTAAGAAAAAAADKKTAAAEAGTHEAGCSGGGGGSQHVGLPPPSPPPPPPWLEALTSQELRSWAAHLIGLWPVLARRVSAATAKRPQCHTLLPLPRPFVAPGDRFRECYYWDSYWVVRGLLVCGMASTATAIVDNLLHLLQAHGYVPNGGRSYYLNRSQPPLLSAMVSDVYEATRDESLLRRALPLLIKEHEYYTTGAKQVLVRAAGGPTADDGGGGDCAVHSLSRYWADLTQPRPESYREDLATAKAAETAGRGGEEARAQLFRDIASAAESGWDFSSRWLADGCSLHTIRTTRIIPADLNALLYRMERHIASFAAALGAHFTVRRFEAAADQRRTALNSLMWDDALGGWSDLLLSDQPIVCPASPHTLSASVVAAVVMPQPPQPLHSSDGQERSGSGVGDSGGARPQPGSFSGGGSSGCPALNVSPPASPVVGVSRLIGRGTYASSWVPLHCGVAGDDKQAAAAVDGLKRSGLLHTVGVATSDVESGQQWDAPNVWPPLQQMIIAGCRLYGGEAGAALAADLTRSWLEAGLMGFKSTGAMHEKYNASKSDGAAGSGGEYAPQVGFGWTNGVALELLAETVAVARSTINMRGDAGGASAAAFAAAR